MVIHFLPVAPVFTVIVQKIFFNNRYTVAAVSSNMPGSTSCAPANYNAILPEKTGNLLRCSRQGSFSAHCYCKYINLLKQKKCTGRTSGVIPAMDGRCLVSANLYNNSKKQQNYLQQNRHILNRLHMQMQFRLRQYINIVHVLILSLFNLL